MILPERLKSAEAFDNGYQWSVDFVFRMASSELILGGIRGVR
jgi:hypothetical protein